MPRNEKGDQCLNQIGHGLVLAHFSPTGPSQAYTRCFLFYQTKNREWLNTIDLC